MGRAGENNGPHSEAMNAVTVDEFLVFKPCNPPYTKEYLEKLWGGKKRLAPLEMLAKSEVPIEDRLWAIYQVCPNLNHNQLAARLRNMIRKDTFPTEAEERLEHCKQPSDVAYWALHHGTSSSADVERQIVALVEDMLR